MIEEERIRVLSPSSATTSTGGVGVVRVERAARENNGNGGRESSSRSAGGARSISLTEKHSVIGKSSSSFTAVPQTRHVTFNVERSSLQQTMNGHNYVIGSNTSSRSSRLRQRSESDDLFSGGGNAVRVLKRLKQHHPSSYGNGHQFQRPEYNRISIGTSDKHDSQLPQKSVNGIASSYASTLSNGQPPSTMATESLMNGNHIQRSTQERVYDTLSSSSSNVVRSFLFRREVGCLHRHHRNSSIHRGNDVRHLRKLYEYIVPEKTYEAVENCPSCLLRRFTDDGKLLLAFSSCGNNFLAFRYTGRSFATAYEMGRDGMRREEDKTIKKRRTTIDGSMRMHSTVRRDREDATYHIGSNTGDVMSNYSMSQPGQDLASNSNSHERTNGVNNSSESLQQGQNERTGASFQDYFEIAFNTQISSDPMILGKDFCINLLNGEMVLLVSYSFPNAEESENNNDRNRNGTDVNRNNNNNNNNSNNNIESDSNFLPSLPNYKKLSFHIIRLSDGQLTDTYTFHNSFVQLAHNGGVHVMNDLILILNLKMQRFHILQVRPDGTFLEVRCIGPHCFEDDELVLRTQVEEEARFRTERGGELAADNKGTSTDMGTRTGSEEHNNNSLPNVGVGDNQAERTSSRSLTKIEKKETGMLSGLRQRLLTYIYRDAQARDRKLKRKDAVRNFFSRFDTLCELYFIRAQFLDRSHLLIRLSGFDAITSRSNDAAQQSAYFVLYDFENARIEGFFRNTDESLLNVVEQNISSFSLPPGSPPWTQLATICDGLRKRCLYLDGMSASSIKRALYTLPTSRMNYCCSPYLDHSLFQYDERMVATADRPRPCAEHPVKFFLRSKPSSFFKIAPPFSSYTGDTRGKKLVAYIFHPIFPFVVSILHGSQRSQLISFHTLR